MRNAGGMVGPIGGGTGATAGGYGWGGGYGPGAGPQSGGNIGSGARTPGFGNWVYDVDDPFYRTGYTSAEHRFQPGHQTSSIDPNFYYGRADWQASKNSPEYQQWFQKAKQQQLLLMLMKRLGLNIPGFQNPFLRPPNIDTPWDDARNSIRSVGPMKPYWSGFSESPTMSSRPNYW